MKNEDKVLFKSNGEFIKIKSYSESPFYYAERKGIDSVAFILVDESRVVDKFGLVNEGKPPLADRYGKTRVTLDTAFGGSNDNIDVEEYESMNGYEKINHMRRLVITETEEESGYTVDADRVNFVSKEFVSTQMNQFCYLFIVDVTGLDQGKKTSTDELESRAYVKWLDSDMVALGNDWKSKLLVNFWFN